MDHDFIRAVAEDHSGRGVLPDDLCEPAGNCWSPHVFVSIGCDWASRFWDAHWLQWGGHHGAGRIFLRRIRRHGVAVLPAGHGTAVLRRREWRDKRSLPA